MAGQAKKSLTASQAKKKFLYEEHEIFSFLVIISPQYFLIFLLMKMKFGTDLHQTHK
jgi:hypothetical protein